MTGYNPLAAARIILIADPEVARLTSGRVYAPELPEKQAQEMSRPCIVLRNTGGGSLGPGARSRAPWTNTRLDVQSFGKTPSEASEIHWAVHEVLIALERTVVDDTVVNDVVVTGGPINSRDADTDWPFALGIFDLASAYATP